MNGEVNSTTIANGTLSSFYGANKELTKEDLQNSVNAFHENNYAAINW